MIVGMPWNLLVSSAAALSAGDNDLFLRQGIWFPVRPVGSAFPRGGSALSIDRKENLHRQRKSATLPRVPVMIAWALSGYGCPGNRGMCFDVFPAKSISVCIPPDLVDQIRSRFGSFLR